MFDTNVKLSRLIEKKTLKLVNIGSNIVRIHSNNFSILANIVLDRLLYPTYRLG